MAPDYSQLQHQESPMHSHKVVATARTVADVAYELEEHNRMELWAMSAEAERISGDLETRVEELALKRYSPKKSFGHGWPRSAKQRQLAIMLR